MAKPKTAKTSNGISELNDANFIKDSLHSQLTTTQLSSKQADLFNIIKDNDIIFIQGPAGTAKTFTVCYSSIKLFSNFKNPYKRIILTKPVQESGEKLGFLPGDVGEKVDPYMQSYYSNFNKIIGDKLTKLLIENRQLVIQPLAYMRGTTYDDCIMLLDEAQNCDFRQLYLFTTRLGKNSKIVIFGDVSQYDIKYDKVALPKFMEMMEGINKVQSFEFTNDDIVRNPILIEIADRYDRYKYENEFEEQNFQK